MLLFVDDCSKIKKNSPKLSSILRETFWLNSCGPPVRLAKISCPRRLLFLRRMMRYDNVLINTDKLFNFYNFISLKDRDRQEIGPDHNEPRKT